MAVFIGNDTLTYLANSVWTAPATQDYTLMCWTYLNSATAAGNYRAFCAIEPNIVLSTFSDGVTLDVGTSLSDNNGKAIPVQQWTHVCCTTISTAAAAHWFRGYVNAQLQVDTASTDAFSASTGILIGNYSQSYPLNSNICDVRIWKRALNQAEVRREMMSSTPVEYGDLILWCPFENDMTQDVSGRGLNIHKTGTGTVSLVGGPVGIAYPGRGMRGQFR